MSFEVQVVREKNLPLVVLALSRAFMTDPVAQYIFPDPKNREERLRQFFHVQLRYNYLPRGEVYTTPDCMGAAVWIPPRPLAPTPRDLLAQIPLYLVSMIRSRGVIRLAKLLAAHRPRLEHYYLGTLGTDPAHQRQGLASALLRPVLDRCDESRIPAFLECSSEENVGFYSRQGFVVTEKIAAPRDGPAIWLMWREPRSRV